MPTRIKVKEDQDGVLRVDNRGGLAGWVIAGVLLGVVVAITVGNNDLKERTALAKDAARIGHYDEAWQHLQLRPVKRHVQSERQCARYSSGQVRQFFAGTPCRSLKRALLVVGTGADTIAISVAWVQMPSTSTASRLKQTLDQVGTGDIYPISGQVLKLGAIRFTGRHYSARQSGALIVTAEAERVRGNPPAELLDAVTQVAAQLPPR